MYRYNPLDGDGAKIAYDEAYYRGQDDRKLSPVLKNPYTLKNDKYKYMAYIDGWNGNFHIRGRHNR